MPKPSPLLKRKNIIYRQEKRSGKKRRSAE
nr:MAG TPA: MgtA leader peptide [Caudoviricetes sp.]